jgi:hypothetical protein
MTSLWRFFPPKSLKPLTSLEFEEKRERDCFQWRCLYRLLF